MKDVTQAMQAKSDQLNAVDIMGADRVIRIRDVQVRQSGEQLVSIYFDGDNNKPWKPSKGMIRILSAGWGNDADVWIGKYVQIYCDASVVYAGKEVGGIRIRAMSDIPQAGIKAIIAISKQKREPYIVKHLSSQRAEYPADKFNKALPAMAAKMQSGEMSLQQIVAQCQKTGDLTADQLSKLEASAPKEVEEGDVEIEQQPKQEKEEF